MNKKEAIETLEKVMVFVNSYAENLRTECDENPELWDIHFHDLDSLVELSGNIGNTISGISMIISEK